MSITRILVASGVLLYILAIPAFAVAQLENVEITIKAHGDEPYENVVAVIDKLQVSKIKSVKLVTVDGPAAGILVAIKAPRETRSKALNDLIRNLQDAGVERFEMALLEPPTKTPAKSPAQAQRPPTAQCKTSVASCPRPCRQVTLPNLLQRLGDRLTQGFDRSRLTRSKCKCR
jgi:hypothetical protein